MRLLAENLYRQPCKMNAGVHSFNAHVLPAKRSKCTGMGKGFADRGVANVELPIGESKARLRKKVHRRERISQELKELQAAELRTPAKAPLQLTQRSSGSQLSSARPPQQQLRPEEVASLAQKLQEEVFKLQNEIRSSLFYR